MQSHSTASQGIHQGDRGVRISPCIEDDRRFFSASLMDPVNKITFTIALTKINFPIPNPLASLVSALS